MDHLTFTGANDLAARIRKYWQARGMTVSTYVEINRIKGGGGDQKGDFYCVRSDMVNGHPIVGTQHSVNVSKGIP